MKGPQITGNINEQF